MRVQPCALLTRGDQEFRCIYVHQPSTFQEKEQRGAAAGYILWLLPYLTFTQGKVYLSSMTPQITDNAF